MKKIIFASLLMVSTIAFAKTEEPKLKTDLALKGEKTLTIKQEAKDEKVEEVTGLESERTPFSDCVLNNSIGLFATFFVAGIPVDGDFIQSLATVQCASSFGLLP